VCGFVIIGIAHAHQKKKRRWPQRARRQLPIIILFSYLSALIALRACGGSIIRPSTRRWRKPHTAGYRYPRMISQRSTSSVTRVYTRPSNR
jgi:hypothetical protein